MSEAVLLRSRRERFKNFGLVGDTAAVRVVCSELCLVLVIPRPSIPYQIHDLLDLAANGMDRHTVSFAPPSCSVRDLSHCPCYFAENY